MGRIGRIIKSFINTNAESSAPGFKITSIFNPTILVIGGVIAFSLVLLMLLPLASMGSTNNLSIMQALSPSNDGTSNEVSDSGASTGKILLIARLNLDGGISSSKSK